MYIRNSSGDLVSINQTSLSQMYCLIWMAKFGKQLSNTGLNTISVDKMKQYLNNKCKSL
jgi:hypothetical protein